MFDLEEIFSHEIIAKVAKYENTPEIQKPITAIKMLKIDNKNPNLLAIAKNSEPVSPLKCCKYMDYSKFSGNSEFVESINKATIKDILNSDTIDLLTDDVNWLHQLLAGCSSLEKKILLSQYVVMWVETMNETVNSSTKQNRGRYIANTWIREQIGIRNKSIK